MKISVIKKIKPWLNKIKINNLKKYPPKKTIFNTAVLFFLLLVATYFLRPFYFDFNGQKVNFEKKINKVFNFSTDIKGDITYQVFPTPRILLKEVNLSLDNTRKNPIIIKELNIPISPIKLFSLEKIVLKSVLITEQKIQIYPVHIKNIFKYLTLNKKQVLKIKNSEIFFIDEQKNSVVFKKVNFTENFSIKKHQISTNFDFSENKVKVNFTNQFNSEKFLKIKIPYLKQSLDINFDKTSTLNKLSGQLKLKIFETLIQLNFEGKDDFKLSKSFIRNKFLNSKIDGKIAFKDEFNFNINMDINQINLRRLLLYYPIFAEKGGISKKINGKINASSKSVDSLFGKITNVNANLVFENGDLRIDNLQASLPEKGKIKSTISFQNNPKKSEIDFNIDFSTKLAKKFMRKFGIYDFKKNQFSLFIDGRLDLRNKKAILKNIIKNGNERISSVETKTISKSFNENIMKEGALGLFDFFKFKKFLKDIY